MKKKLTNYKVIISYDYWTDEEPIEAMFAISATSTQEAKKLAKEKFVKRLAVRIWEQLVDKPLKNLHVIEGPAITIGRET